MDVVECTTVDVLLVRLTVQNAEYINIMCLPKSLARLLITQNAGVTMK